MAIGITLKKINRYRFEIIPQLHINEEKQITNRWKINFYQEFQHLSFELWLAFTDVDKSIEEITISVHE